MDWFSRASPAVVVPIIDVLYRIADVNHVYLNPFNARGHHSFSVSFFNAYISLHFRLHYRTRILINDHSFLNSSPTKLPIQAMQCSVVHFINPVLIAICGATSVLFISKIFCFPMHISDQPVYRKFRATWNAEWFENRVPMYGTTVS